MGGTMFSLLLFLCYLFFFFFKQKTAYEMRISDWSSDVCSSDLADACGSSGRDDVAGLERHHARNIGDQLIDIEQHEARIAVLLLDPVHMRQDRKSVV